jgi:MFS family permease
MTAAEVADRLGFAGSSGPKPSIWDVFRHRKLVWGVLRHRKFRWYFGGSVISNFGTWLQNTAQILLAYRLTHSVFAIGLLASAQFLCPLLVGSWAGVLTDRLGSKRTLVASQLGSALVAALLAVAEWRGWLTGTRLIAGALATGLFLTFTLPAQSVIAPTFVSSTDTKAAMAMNSVSYNAGRAIAPGLSVLIVTTIGFTWAFTFNAISFGIFVAVLLTITRETAPPSPSPARSQFMDSFRIAMCEPKILILLLMVAAVTVADDPLLVLGPALARHVFGVSDGWSSAFLSALGIGSVLGSFLPRWRAPSGRRAATALSLLGFSIMVFSLAPWIWLSVVAAFGAGVAGLVAGSATQALLLELAGPGRALQVMGLWAVAWAGSKPIASLVDGALPGLFGIRATGVILAAPTLIPVLILILFPAVVTRAIQPRSPSGTTAQLAETQAAQAVT